MGDLQYQQEARFPRNCNNIQRKQGQYLFPSLLLSPTLQKYGRDSRDPPTPNGQLRRSWGIFRPAVLSADPIFNSRLASRPHLQQSSHRRVISFTSTEVEPEMNIAHGVPFDVPFHTICPSAASRAVSSQPRR